MVNKEKKKEMKARLDAAQDAGMETYINAREAGKSKREARFEGEMAAEHVLGEDYPDVEAVASQLGLEFIQGEELAEGGPKKIVINIPPGWQQ